MKPKNSAGYPMPYSRYDEILKFKDDDISIDWLSCINGLTNPCAEITLGEPEDCSLPRPTPIRNKRRFLLIA